jgi:hypothetical protein
MAAVGEQEEEHESSSISDIKHRQRPLSRSLVNVAGALSY